MDYDDGFRDGYTAGYAAGRADMDMMGHNAPLPSQITPPTPKRKRKKSAWNDFVAVEMPKVLKKHPRFTPQRAMKEVSRRWRSSPKNPNRRKRKR